MAAASELSDQAVNDIWQKGTRRARCVIAGRGRLPLPLTEEILAGDDGELLANWLSAERGKEHTARVTAGRRLEVDRALAYQDHLTEDQKNALSWADSTEVLKPLLLRDDLTEEQRDRALMRYIARERILRSSYGEELINTIETAGNLGTSIERRWSRLMEIVGPDQAALVAEAAERGIRNQEIAGSVADAMKRLAEIDDIAKNTLAVQDLHRACRLLARTPNVPVSTYEELSELDVLAPLRGVLVKRCELGVAEALELLTCGDDASLCAPGHAAIIAALSTTIGDVDLPGEILAPAALTHSHELPRGIIERILVNLHYGPRLLEREQRLGRLSNQVHLIESRSDLYDPAKAHPVELVRELARRGAHVLLQRHLPSTRRDPDGAEAVLEHFQPVRELLADTYYAGLVAERLLTIEGEQREFVNRLIGEWDGSLLELIEAAKTV